jgi:hypothetical protein
VINFQAGEKKLPAKVKGLVFEIAAHRGIPTVTGHGGYIRAESVEGIGLRAAAHQRGGRADGGILAKIRTKNASSNKALVRGLLYLSQTKNRILVISGQKTNVVAYIMVVVGISRTLVRIWPYPNVRSLNKLLARYEAK